jgi:23S rRNA (guanine2445-N2)-methyltransferase / 23S rRNA (guanine2069-N7)-methyltransferase
MSATPSYNFFAPTPRGIASLLAEELRQLGALEIDEQRAGVGFQGPLEIGYRACLWSRLASRVLLVLDDAPASTSDELYESVSSLRWDEHLSPTGTLAVNFNGTSPNLRHTHFGALRVKDAIVDGFRERNGTRPSVDVESPDLRVDVHLHGVLATISIDLSGRPLHRRGYRAQPVDAPLRENLAAAVLMRGDWAQVAAGGGPLVDLMCGSGTLLIEGAWMAADRAPAMERPDLGLLRWAGHDQRLWDGLIKEARERYRQGLETLPQIVGYDIDPNAVRATRVNLRGAGLSKRVHVETRALVANAGPDDPAGPGLVVANPPYGERLSDETAVRVIFADMSQQLHERFAGWRAAILTTSAEWAIPLSLSSGPADIFYNGALECPLLHGVIPARRVVTPTDPEPGTTVWDSKRGTQGPGAKESGHQAHSAPPATFRSDGAQMLANRLRKNLRTLGKWARREGVTCYRLYDADLPEYAVAVDLYESVPQQRRWAHVQEYRAPVTIDPAKAAARLQEALPTIVEELGIAREDLHFKLRERKKGKTQYQRLSQGGEYHEVSEAGISLWVNFTDYLDTGLFLDHRPTREIIGELAAGKHFLNLFGYTGSATVYAAAGGAVATTTVDMSNTYIEWARRNLHGNGFRGAPHNLIQADCLAWLDIPRAGFDLIFLDPPTFSNSKRMDSAFDVLEDHAELIRRTARLLNDGGLMLFSTNARQFKMDTAALPDLECRDITWKTIPKDFERNAKIHQCWSICARVKAE